MDFEKKILEKDVDEMAGRISGLELDNVNLMDEISKLNDSIEGYKAKIESLKEEEKVGKEFTRELMNSFNSTKKDLENLAASLEKEKAEREKEKVEMERKQRKLNEDLEVSKEKLRKTMTELESWERKYNVTYEYLKESEKNTYEWEQACRQKEDDYKRVTGEASRMKMRIESLKCELSTLEKIRNEEALSNEGQLRDATSKIAEIGRAHV